MKTRHQRQLEEQGGAVPSPPRMLTDAPRPKRTRAPKSSAAEGSSSKSQTSSTQPSLSSTRSGRITQRGRGRGGRRAPQPHVTPHEDSPEASDTSTHQDASAQSDTSEQADEGERRSTEDTHGETPTSLLGTASHPVFAPVGIPPQASQQPGTFPVTTSAHPVRVSGIPDPLHSNTHPVSAAGAIPPSTPIAQPVPEKSSSSETSRLFARLLSSPESPITLGTRPPESGYTGKIQGIALIEALNPSPDPTPEKPVAAQSSAHDVGTTSLGGSAGAQPELPNPAVPQLPTVTPYGLPQMYPIINLPAMLKEQYSIMHIVVNSHAPTDGTYGPWGPTENVAIAVPTNQLPYHALLAATMNPETAKELQTNPVITKILNESKLTQTVDLEVNCWAQTRTHDYGDVITIQQHEARERTKGAPREPAKKTANEPRTAPKTAKRSREALEESEANGSPRKRVQIVPAELPDWYDEHGNLDLSRLSKQKDPQPKADGAGSTMPRVIRRTSLFENQPLTQNPYANDEVPDTHEQPIQGLYGESQEQAPQTPPSRRWGISSFLPSAQTVSKFIFASRGTPWAAAAPSRDDLNPTAQRENASRGPRTQQQPSKSQQRPRTKPRDDKSVTNGSKASTNNGMSRYKYASGVRVVHGQIRDTPSLYPPATILATVSPQGRTPHEIINGKGPRNANRVSNTTGPQTANDVSNSTGPETANEVSNSTGPELHVEITRSPSPQSKDLARVDEPTHLRFNDRLITHDEAGEYVMLKREKDEVRELRLRLEQEQLRIAKEKKDWEEQRAKLETAQIPGKKRKRLPSPDVIPLPPGGGFGLHPDYFDYISSDEEESDQEQDTPTKPRPSKKARLSMEDPLSAAPYDGGHFTLPAKKSVVNSGDSSNTDTAVTSAQNASTTTPSVQPGRFTVPSPSDSDDEETATHARDAESSPTPSKLTAPDASNDDVAPVKELDQLDPVEKARQKILKHQPTVGSRLRQSSRLSASTAGSDAGIEAAEADTQYDDSQYDPRQPHIPQAIIEAIELNKSMNAGKSTSLQIPEADDVSATTNPNADDDWTEEQTQCLQEAIQDMFDGLFEEFAYDAYRDTLPDKLRVHLDKTKAPFEDAADADEEMERDFQQWKAVQDEEEGTATVSSESTGTDQPAPFVSAYQDENLDDKVRAFIDETCAPEDDPAESEMGEFEEHFEAWKAAQGVAT